MANLMKKAAERFAAKTKSHAATEITYRRGANEATITATVSKTVFKFQDPSSGATIRVESRDYLIQAADLVLGGLAVEPDRGDEIIEDGEKYKALPTNGEPVWNWNDNARTQYRVHTKRIGSI